MVLNTRIIPVRQLNLSFIKHKSFSLDISLLPITLLLYISNKLHVDIFICSSGYVVLSFRSLFGYIHISGLNTVSTGRKKKKKGLHYQKVIYHEPINLNLFLLRMSIVVWYLFLVNSWKSSKFTFDIFLFRKYSFVSYDNTESFPMLFFYGT